MPTMSPEHRQLFKKYQESLTVCASKDRKLAVCTSLFSLLVFLIAYRVWHPFWSTLFVAQALASSVLTFRCIRRARKFDVRQRMVTGMLRARTDGELLFWYDQYEAAHVADPLTKS